MSNLIESDRWEDGIYQLETSDPVIGGPDGVDNLQAKQLANRTRFLKRLVEAGQSNLDAHASAVDPHPQYATKADLAQRLAELVDQSPEALNTLKELADALGNDPNFATTITNELAKKSAIDSPVFTGTPKGPTPPQFDNTTKLATTAFVRSLGMQANAFTTLVGAATLTAANAGGSIYLGGAGNYTVTLPLASSVPAGARIEFVSGVGASPVTISRQGTDTIYMNASTSLATVPMALGDTYVLESNGVNWYSVGGSTPLAYTGGFGASLSASGYQKLPSGLIIQWGLFQINFSSTPQTASGVVTYPLAFPNGVLSVTATSLSSTPSAYPAPSVVLTSASQFTAYAYGAVNNAGQSYYYIAIGR
ncbi:hypothetical protein WL48_25450 [Burkholderia ubonensis]|uniref:gp53-like domain-containing protein n=1 Tax=Burkholderia ubonensis TaxID=101571 RepID=UPI000753BCE9|nr:hypothetical protein [Burkholderia ubonensis]KWC29328.1 hypothetical protein WL48_25450 [Burkholderia ubonensis]KWC45124.1 hypothetical protein WL49_01110 [Burkholderia ubonensis]KWO22016.1 hypothetical protein WM25_10450 [Burkholderia ubonensis]